MSATKNMRNIGISAHIDSGKTTLTERMLYYCKKIHAMHEVRGKDGVGATMDSMELEKERGITIASAATNVTWKDCSINIIDTPGHVDFTIEVERALRVLDGAILVLCAVGGVQSQSITVDRQLKRYGVPNLAFINKCDRVGADPYKVKEQLYDKLGHNAVLMQIPIGLEDKFEGIVDLITMKAVYFDGPGGDIIREEEIPAELVPEATARREELVDAVSMFCDELAEHFLEGKETAEQIYSAVRSGVLARKLTPVFLGTAFKNKGVQLLMDAVVKYLPSPLDTEYEAFNLDKNEEKVALKPENDLPTISLAFKLEDGQYGQLTYLRIYQGMIKKGMELYNTRAQRKIRVGRLVRMHADNMEEIDTAECGDIIALFGVECNSGDTFTGEKLNYAMTSMFVPQPVISLAVKTKDKKSEDNLAKALTRFTREDPTFQTYVDDESNETIIRGMGELHLDVYIERMRREYKVELDVGRPQVAYRESITQQVSFDYTHKKQSGGQGQYARIAGILEPTKDADFEFADATKGGVIPREFIPSCEKGFRKCLDKGTLIGFPIVGVKVTINDGTHHPVDSSDLAFQMAAIGAFREVYFKAKPEILEPVMKVSVETPSEFQGNVFSSLNQRRGLIVSTIEDTHFSRIEAEVPLQEMFGYSTALRSITQGKAEFTMEFAKYGRVPAGLSENLIKEYQKQK
ncbi:MAG: elongation factor G [Spirochaetales bacterium]|nr:elongation factor G [Spirochaetales bacterium]